MPPAPTAPHDLAAAATSSVVALSVALAVSACAAPATTPEGFDYEEVVGRVAALPPGTVVFASVVEVCGGDTSAAVERWHLPTPDGEPPYHGGEPARTTDTASAGSPPVDTSTSLRSRLRLRALRLIGRADEFVLSHPACTLFVSADSVVTTEQLDSALEALDARLR